MLYLDIYTNIIYSLITVIFSIVFVHMIFSALFEVFTPPKAPKSLS